jgi:hypothetical protein
MYALEESSWWVLNRIKTFPKGTLTRCDYDPYSDVAFQISP